MGGPATLPDRPLPISPKELSWLHSCRQVAVHLGGLSEFASWRPRSYQVSRCRPVSPQGGGGLCLLCGGRGSPGGGLRGADGGKGVREVLRSGGEGWDRLFGVRARGWSRCGSICVRVGESRGRFHLRLGEEQHDRLFRKQLQAVGSGVLGAEAVCLLFGSSNV